MPDIGGQLEWDMGKDMCYLELCCVLLSCADVVV